MFLVVCRLDTAKTEKKGQKLESLGNLSDQLE